MGSAIEIEAIARSFVERFGAHTVILYGSRARGDATPTSDWDLLAIRETGESFREARRLEVGWLDAFVHPESHFAELEEASLAFLSGRVLYDERGFGRALLERIAAFEARGPQRPPDAADNPSDDILRVWYEKTLVRIARGDVEARFRRAFLLVDALRDYFRFRRAWYRGPKESLLWLEKNDAETFLAFDRALAAHSTHADLEALVARILT